MINPGGAYFGADRYELALEVGQDASLLSTTQSATKVYRTPQGPARQDMEVRLGPGAVLEHLPDQLIVYREGSYRQRTLVRMHPTASLVMAEIITPGWSPDGEPFRFDEVRLRTEVQVEDDEHRRRLVVDQLRMVPDAGQAITGSGMMEGRSHTGQLLIADRRLDDELYEQLASSVEDSATLSGITRGGLPHPDGLRCVAIRSWPIPRARLPRCTAGSSTCCGPVGAISPRSTCGARDDRAPTLLLRPADAPLRGFT